MTLFWRVCGAGGKGFGLPSAITLFLASDVRKHESNSRQKQANATTVLTPGKFRALLLLQLHRSNVHILRYSIWRFVSRFRERLPRALRVARDCRCGYRHLMSRSYRAWIKRLKKTVGGAKQRPTRRHPTHTYRTSTRTHS